jgi:hypothetical protein
MASEGEDRGPLFLGIFTAGTAVSIIVVSLRFWIRTRMIRKVSADDWIMLASLVIPTSPVYEIKERRDLQQ